MISLLNQVRQWKSIEYTLKAVVGLSFVLCLYLAFPHPAFADLTFSWPISLPETINGIQYSDFMVYSADGTGEDIRITFYNSSATNEHFTTDTSPIGTSLLATNVGGSDYSFGVNDESSGFANAITITCSDSSTAGIPLATTLALCATGSSSGYSGTGSGNIFWNEGTWPNQWSVSSRSIIDDSSFAVLVSGGGFGVPDTSTHFISLTPTDASSSVATTTTLGQTGYVNGVDLSSTTKVSVAYVNVGCDSLSGSTIQAFNGTCNFTLTNPVSTLGSFDFSTSTTFDFGGKWTYTATISDISGSYCVFGYCLFSNSTNLTQQRGYFIVGAPNAVDLINQYFASSSETATSTDLSSCNVLLGFNAATCVYNLLVPNSAQFTDFVSGYSGAFFSYPPLGYLTRAVVILNSGTTTPLPTISYTFPAAVGGYVFILNPWTAIGTSSLLNTATSSNGETLQQIASPGYDLFWSLILVLAIIYYFVGFNKSSE